MCVSTQIPDLCSEWKTMRDEMVGGDDSRHEASRQERLNQVARIAGLRDGSDINHQFMPNESRNTSNVSRFDCIKAAIKTQLERLVIKQPKKRVVLITFNDEVTIYGLSSPIIIGGDKLDKFDELQKTISSRDSVSLPLLSTFTTSNLSNFLSLSSRINSYRLKKPEPQLLALLLLLLLLFVINSSPIFLLIDLLLRRLLFIRCLIRPLKSSFARMGSRMLVLNLFLMVSMPTALISTLSAFQETPNQRLIVFQRTKQKHQRKDQRKRRKRRSK